MFFTVSLALLILAAVVSIGILLYSLFLRNNLVRVGDLQSDARAALSKERLKSADFLALSERLSNIEKIVPSNASFSNLLSPIAESIPDSIDVDDITVDQSTVSVTLTTSDLATLNTYLNTNLKKLVGRKETHIKNVTIQNFGINDATGNYSTAIRFIYN